MDVGFGVRPGKNWVREGRARWCSRVPAESYIYYALGCILLTKCTQAIWRVMFGAAADRQSTDTASQPR
jgi:hypothetical protein